MAAGSSCGAAWLYGTVRFDGLIEWIRSPCVVRRCRGGYVARFKHTVKRLWSPLRGSAHATESELVTAGNRAARRSDTLPAASWMNLDSAEAPAWLWKTKTTPQQAKMPCSSKTTLVKPALIRHALYVVAQSSRGLSDVSRSASPRYPRPRSFVVTQKYLVFLACRPRRLQPPSCSPAPQFRIGRISPRSCIPEACSPSRAAPQAAK